MIQTLEQILEQVSIDYDFTTSIVSSASSEYSRRVALANRAADKWASTRQYQWPELLQSTTVTADGSANVAMPSGFSPNNVILTGGGSILAGGVYFTLIPYNAINAYPDTEPVVYFTGNPASGYYLTFSSAIENGVSIPVDYFTTDLATNTSGTSQEKLVVSTDKTKCPRPMYIVYSILADLFRVDEDVDAGRSVKFEDMAIIELDSMLGNLNAGAINQSNVIEDVAYSMGYPGLGR